MSGGPLDPSGSVARDTGFRVALIGANGRMGRILCALLEEAPVFELVLEAERNLVPAGQEERAEGEPPTRLEELAPGDLDAVIEFTTARAVPAIGHEVERLRVAWLSGTTGLDVEGRAALERAAKLAPVLSAPNFSIGVAVLKSLLERAAQLLSPGWELEIVERHHAAKVDAPSGTALALAERWSALRGGENAEQKHGRSGRVGPRVAGEIGIHAVRLPEGIGEHRLLLGGRGEEIELLHRATDRSAFAHGAIEALRWLVGQPPHLYTLDDWLADRMATLPGESRGAISPPPDSSNEGNETR